MLFIITDSLLMGLHVSSNGALSPIGVMTKCCLSSELLSKTQAVLSTKALLVALGSRVDV